MMNRRQALQASRSSSSGGGGTILFLFFPLALLFYVWNTVQEEPNMIDPHDATFKKVGGGVGHNVDVWDVRDNDTSTTFEEEEEDVTTWYNHNNNDDDEEEKKEAQLQEDMDEQIPISGLWIMVESWQPGVPHWQQALAEVVVLAKSLSAVLVEPNIANAALVPCHFPQSSIALSHIYNRTRIIEFYPHLASCTKYGFAINQLTAPKIWNVCFHPNSDDCEDDTFYQVPINTVLEDAMEYVSTHPHNMALLRLHHVWESSLDALTLPVEPIHHQPPSDNKEPSPPPPPSKRTPPIIDRAMVTTFQTQHLEFASRQYQWLHMQLQTQGIPYASYAVIHWNPPPPTTTITTNTTTNITHCVDTILQVQRAMNLPRTTPFFLITTQPQVDIDLDGTVDETTTSSTTPTSVGYHQALDMLYQEHQFLKLETVLPILQRGSSNNNNNKNEEVDAIIPIVMNLILAEQAFSFTTCATTTTTPTTSTSITPNQQPKKKKKKQEQQQPKSCHLHFPMCETCHAGGIFGEWALALRQRRQDENPNTLPCWPQTSSELPTIHNLWYNNQG